MWDYFYYHLYLKSIDVYDHNVIEKYAYEQVTNHILSFVFYFLVLWFVLQIRDNKTDFFPLFHAKCLKDKNETSTSTELNELKNMVMENQVANKDVIV